MADQKPKEKKAFKKKLLHKYRLVVLNEDTFEERVSFKLTRLNVFILSGVFTILLIGFTTLLIAYTPLREYIPGYSSTALKKKATALISKTDSLEYTLRVNQQYYQNVQRILSGDIPAQKFDRDSIREQLSVNIDSINLNPSKEDSILRERVAREDKYNIAEPASLLADFTLFPPVKGQTTNVYNAIEKHFGVDVVAEKDAPVKSAADGTVVFAEWTADTGHVLIIEHRNNLITVYKHNSSLAKTQGDVVLSGEVIATVGNTGELTTGPHLHFELWSNGYPVNPENFIDFN